ncbi:hypothetical protein HYH03_009242 [Edaphochlamys debaryana]|uniref:Uncharacterized protein n=1 Tax=Edaphochlamys debaryana TaxID=47281 RepID=A0A836BXC1_9CHLO|nr:hypothetical protein HYH03_009242 [Edaphochlamys debaryana]|eukprot:KAG2492581.1 hypothetical protein HYH03_009242 [Edaphochlamys debaryana]
MQRLDPPDMVAAAGSCRGWGRAAAKSGALQRKRLTVAEHAWWAALDELPWLAKALVGPTPLGWDWHSIFDEYRERSSAAPTHLVLPRPKALVQTGPSESTAERKDMDEHPDLDDHGLWIPAFEIWEQRRVEAARTGTIGAEAAADVWERSHMERPDICPLDDPSWRCQRQKAALRMIASMYFPVYCLQAALPLRPEALEHLRYRLGLAPAGAWHYGNWGPGPRLPYLDPAEVAEHSPVEGRLAMWLLGMEGLMRTGYELEAARAWAWAGPLPPTRSQATTAPGGGGGSGGGGGGQPLMCPHLEDAVKAAGALIKFETVGYLVQDFTVQRWRADGPGSRLAEQLRKNGMPLPTPMPALPTIYDLMTALADWRWELEAGGSTQEFLGIVDLKRRKAEYLARAWLSVVEEHEAALLVLKGCR